MSLRSGDPMALLPGMTFQFVTRLWLDDTGLEFGGTVITENNAFGTRRRVSIEHAAGAEAVAEQRSP